MQCAVHSFSPLSPLLSLGWENLHTSHFVVAIGLMLLIWVGLRMGYCPRLVQYHLLSRCLEFTSIHTLPWAIILLESLRVRVRVKCLLLQLECCCIDCCRFFHELFVWVEIWRFNGASYYSCVIHIQFIVVVVWSQGGKLICLVVSLSYVTSWWNLMTWNNVVVTKSLTG